MRSEKEIKEQINRFQIEQEMYLKMFSDNPGIFSIDYRYCKLETIKREIEALQWVIDELSL